jgi:cytochrome c-type biogenesis protein CcmH/NrfF
MFRKFTGPRFEGAGLQSRHKVRRVHAALAAEGMSRTGTDFLQGLPSSKRLWQSLVVCLLAVLMLGANDPAARYGRIGHNMMCVCSCGQVLLECNHVGCPDSDRMVGELKDQTAASSDDKAVYNWFVSKYGATVLAAPIRGGFDNLAWILPIAVFILAIFGTAFLVRMWGQRRRVAAAGAPAPEPLGDTMRDRIRRETEWQ